MRKQFYVSAIVLVCVFVLGLAASTSAGENQRKLAAESAIEQIAKRGVIKVGMDVFVPWAMKDKKGELIGFEIDMAKKTGKRHGPQNRVYTYEMVRNYPRPDYRQV